MFYLIIIIIVVFVFLFKGEKTNNYKTSKNIYPSNNFSIFLEKKVEVLSKEIPTEHEFIKVFMNGLVKGPYDGYNAKIKVSMFDITSGVEKNVLCTLESFQQKESIIFDYNRNMKMPYQNTVIDKYEVLRVPTMFLEFPNSGRITLRVQVQVLDSYNKTLESSTSTLLYNSIQSGYLELFKNKKKFQEVLIKTAVLVGMSDGFLGYEEKAIIEEWIIKESFSINLGHLYDELKEAVIEGEQEAKKGYNIYNYLLDIDDFMTEGQKYELYELCLKVAGSDGTAASEELEIIREIAVLLNLETFKFQTMIEKFLPVTMHESNDITQEEMIGITSNMNKQEKKRHLMGEYRKWNARVGNSDPKIRDQAEEMTMIIAELRKKYR